MLRFHVFKVVVKKEAQIPPMVEYLKSALSSDRMVREMDTKEAMLEALRKLDHTNKEDFIQFVQQYLSEREWKLTKNALYQKKYLDNNELVNIRALAETRDKISEAADFLGKPIHELLEELVEGLVNIPMVLDDARNQPIEFKRPVNEDENVIQGDFSQREIDFEERVEEDDNDEDVDEPDYFDYPVEPEKPRLRGDMVFITKRHGISYMQEFLGPMCINETPMYTPEQRLKFHNYDGDHAYQAYAESMKNGLLTRNNKEITALFEGFEKPTEKNFNLYYRVLIKQAKVWLKKGYLVSDFNVEEGMVYKKLPPIAKTFDPALGENLLEMIKQIYGVHDEKITQRHKTVTILVGHAYNVQIATEVYKLLYQYYRDTYQRLFDKCHWNMKHKNKLIRCRDKCFDLAEELYFSWMDDGRYCDFQVLDSDCKHQLRYTAGERYYTFTIIDRRY